MLAWALLAISLLALIFQNLVENVLVAGRTPYENRFGCQNAKKNCMRRVARKEVKVKATHEMVRMALC